MSAANDDVSSALNVMFQMRSFSGNRAISGERQTPLATTLNYRCHPNNLSLSLKDLYLCKKYDRLSEAWVQRMDRIENNPKKR